MQARLRCHSIYIHCRCHQLQLACVNAAKSVNPVYRVQSNIWKLFYYSPKKASVFRDVQAILAHPLLLSQETLGDYPIAILLIQLDVLFPLAATLESIYGEEGDTETYALAKLAKTIIATVCDALDPVAGLCAALQSKSLDFTELTLIVDACSMHS